MSIKAILFDLDGTLLPMDLDEFIKAYFGTLSKKLEPLGFEPNKLFDSLWAGIKAMYSNDGSCLNEKRFWDKFVEIYGEGIKDNIYDFEEYYKNDFDKVKDSCGFDKKAKWLIDELKKLGYRLTLATNPLFPSIATHKRTNWAGLEVGDFEIITTYENSSFCKPNTKYYEEILNKMNVKPEECLMVGNDVNEDMVASKLGIKVFLLPKCLINKDNKDISSFPQGDFEDLLNYVKSL